MNSVFESIFEESVYHFDLDTYHKLSLSGHLPRNLELIEGILIQKMKISPLHAKVVNKLRKLIERNLPEEFILRQESPLTLIESKSEPEPDLAILKGKDDDFTDSHPTTALWVIEISNTSLNMDRAKINSYASANISVYWIIDLVKQQVEVYDNLQGIEYLDKKIFSKEERIPFPIIEVGFVLSEIL